MTAEGASSKICLESAEKPLSERRRQSEYN